MASYEEVINGNINSLKELKDLVKSFKDELATAKEGSQEWKNAVEGLSVAQERLDKINKAAKGTLEGYNNSAKDSINTLKARIKELNTERNAMDMNSQEYADATAQLKELNTRLREAGTSAGDMHANVGNYAESLAAGFSGVKDAVAGAASQMTTAIGGLGQSMGALSPTLGTLTTGFQGLSAATGAVGLALAAIAAVLAAFKEGIQSSETNTNKFREALAPLQAILVLIQRAIQEVTGKVLDWMIALRQNETVMNIIKTVMQVLLTMFIQTKKHIQDVIGVFTKWGNAVKTVADKLKNVFQPVVETITKVTNTVREKLQPVIAWIQEKWNWLAKTDVGKLLGIRAIEDVESDWEKAGNAVEEFGDKVKEVEDEIKDINNDDIALQQRKRSLMIANAKLEGDLAQKELEIAEEQNKENKDYDRILGLINEKTEIQTNLAKNNLALKQAELAIIQRRNALSDSNTKDIDAENQALAEVVRAQNAVTAAEAAGEREKKKIVSAKTSQKQKEALDGLTAALKDLETQYTNTLNAISKPIAPEGAEIDKDSINAYHDAVLATYQAEYDAYMTMTDGKIARLEEFVAKQKAAGQDTVAQEAEIAKIRAEQGKAYKKLIESQNADDKNRAKALKANYNAQLSAYSGLLDSMSGLFEENTIAYKATATAKAIIDTYQAANAVMAEQQGGLLTRSIAMAATITAGLANVLAIWKTNVKNPSVSTSTQDTARSVPRADTTPYTYSQTVQTVAAEETINQSTEPVQVYVLESDITSAQNKAKVRVAESSW